ncbi:DUF4375 domain-containing protein [Gimesia aquarii]|uniref:DNA mimic protein DMP19 C-terminal domain-containing protein n=1 Tax=Gimesia aquarii TaxID=2527964 RepID=A0A517WVX2_9PLAN|nr:DUF4375 domain-containing protein [Gimesia aquarii]QDU09413.1 hypothetical protein V202x_27880 [Gimesia aquarii]
MTGEEVEKSIIEWLRQHYPEEPDWQNTNFHCFTDEPLELKMIPVFQAIEYNIDNGGWSQFLWNCYGTWPRMVEIAADGYELIGARPQREALELLREILAAHEVECASFMRKAAKERGSTIFAEFTKRSYAQPGNDWQDLFYYNSGINELRLAWLAQHATQVRILMSKKQTLRLWLKQIFSWSAN